MSYASQGNGSTSHLTMELFLSRAGVNLVHVPYRGAAPAANDLAGGHVNTMFCDLGTILPLHLGSKIRIIAVATLPRLSQLPEVPTIDESGVAGFVSTTFFSLMAPPKTPLPVREKLNKAIVAAMASPDAEAKLKTIFVGASPLDVHATGEFIRAQAKLWGDVIRAAHITIEP
jgi:tripartite-type tricarboxylate transporter receptor subunit TctC